MLGRLFASLLGRGNSASAGRTAAEAFSRLYAEAVRMHDGGDSVGARAACLALLDHDPDSLPVLDLLSLAEAARGRVDEAERHLRHALSLGGAAHAGFHLKLGQVLWSKAWCAEAIACFEQALAIDPETARAQSARLFCMSFAAGLDPEEIAQAYRTWGKRYRRDTSYAPRNSPSIDGRRMRIGYLAFDLGNAINLRYLMPVLGAHRRDQVELFMYDNGPGTAPDMAALRALADHWHSVRGLDDAQAEALVRGHGIDVLVDLSGHLDGHRLPLVARRPAPAQVSWLSYPQTTGLDAIDFRISDHHCDPTGAERHYTEGLLRMPHSYWCYQPPDDPAPSMRPVSQAIAFGCLNSFSKLSPPTLDLWARVLAELPGSTMLVGSVPEGESRRRVIAAFEARSVAAERIILRGRLDDAGYRRAYQEIDIALDTFPYNGATTTLDALWMGVPVVTLRGNTCAARAGASILSTLGEPGWIATDEPGYIDIARRLASDREALGVLRATLRERLRASPLMDAGRFASDLEGLYRQAWHACHARAQSRQRGA